MALSRAGLIVDTTSTSGVGTYTLDNPAAPGGGFRNLANAVTAGDPNNADTIYYWVLDTTTEGAVLAFEHGIGTVSGGGTTLARTTVIKSSNSNNAVDWAVGGSRTVRFGVGVAGLGLLGAAQTWTAVQTFSAGWSAAANCALKRTGVVGALDVGSDISTINTTVGRFGFLGHSSTGVERVVAQWQSILTDNTNGSEDGLIRAVTMVNGAGAVVAQIDSGGVKDGSGNYYALSGVLSAPAGTRLLLGNNTVPAGWAIVAAVADKTILTTSTASEIDDQGGSWTISGLTASGSTAGHTLTIGEMPAHTHGPAGAFSDGIVETVTSTPEASLTTGGTYDVANVSATASAGGGGSHSHTISSVAVSSTGAWRPAYYKAGWIEKS